MQREKLVKLYKKYELSKEDIFKHQHYTIITGAVLIRLESVANINIIYEV